MRGVILEFHRSGGTLEAILAKLADIVSDMPPAFGTAKRQYAALR